MGEVRLPRDWIVLLFVCLLFVFSILTKLFLTNEVSKDNEEKWRSGRNSFITVSLWSKQKMFSISNKLLINFWNTTHWKAGGYMNYVLVQLVPVLRYQCSQWKCLLLLTEKNRKQKTKKTPLFKVGIKKKVTRLEPIRRIKAPFKACVHNLHIKPLVIEPTKWQLFRYWERKKTHTRKVYYTTNFLEVMARAYHRKKKGKSIKKFLLGLPWWRSGWESAC